MKPTLILSAVLLMITSYTALTLGKPQWVEVPLPVEVVKHFEAVSCACRPGVGKGIALREFRPAVLATPLGHKRFQIYDGVLEIECSASEVLGHIQFLFAPESIDRNCRSCEKCTQWRSW